MAEIQIPGVDFGKLAQEAIAHQITKALTGVDDHVNAMIAEALSRKVDNEGKLSNRGYGVEIPFMQWVAEDLVRAAVRKALTAKIEEMRPEIEAAVAKALKSTSGDLAKAMVKAFTENALTQPTWAISVEFRDKRR